MAQLCTMWWEACRPNLQQDHETVLWANTLYWSMLHKWEDVAEGSLGCIELFEIEQLIARDVIVWGRSVAEFIDLWLGAKVNSGIGLSYRTPTWLAGRYDNPMPELTLAQGIYEFGYWLFGGIVWRVFKGQCHEILLALHSSSIPDPLPFLIVQYMYRNIWILCKWCYLPLAKKPFNFEWMWYRGLRICPSWASFNF